MKKRAKVGDIFTGEVDENKFMFGRVLMDIKKCFKSKIISMEDSSIKNYSISYVVEIFDAVSDTKNVPSDLSVLIPGIAVNPLAFEYDIWEVTGNESKVDPKEIDFQEDCRIYDGKLNFRRGEIYIQSKLKNKELEEIETGFQANSGKILKSAYSIVQDESNRTELLRYDFRFLKPELRKLIYDAIGENPEMSYYDLALKHGFDTARFFK